jgi:hypothetical protein
MHLPRFAAPPTRTVPISRFPAIGAAHSTNEPCQGRVTAAISPRTACGRESLAQDRNHVCWSGPRSGQPQAAFAARVAARARSVSMGTQRFTAIVAAAGRGKLLVPVPFDPDQVWGAKHRHHIAGTVNGIHVRAVIEPAGAGLGFTLGSTSPARFGVDVGDEVAVEIAPEGPQRDDLADDVAAALAANPDAGAFFDSLAQFYRRGYLRWIDATKRRPDQRAERIANMVKLLKAGVKQRP